MRKYSFVKKGLLLALCTMLAIPAVDLSGGALMAKASSPENIIEIEDKELTEEELAALKAKAKTEILNHYVIYQDKIEDAGNKEAAEARLKAYIGELDAAKPVGGKLAQMDEAGVETILTLLKGEIESWAAEEEEAGPSDSNVMVGGSWVTPIAKAGEYVSVVLPLVNMGEDMVWDAVVTPVISNSAAEWPFEIETSNYTQTAEDLPGTRSGGSDMERRRELTWIFKTRKDAPSGYVKLAWQVTYRNSDNTVETKTLETYVKVTGTTGTSSTGTTSTPRVIVTGFSTDPEVVRAGETFTLTLHMQNTSKSTAVKNILFELEAASESTDTNYVAAAFLPTSGSSTIFVDSISAGRTKNISMELEARSDLSQKPYVVNVSMEYEDENVNSYSNTASVSIPVRQEARVDISNVEVMPETIEVGSEANVMFSIYNIGKTQLYNTNVKLQADSVTGGEAYLGNIAPGATGNVDLYVTGQAATMDEGIVKILITFEDEAGEVTTIEEEMTLFVSEPYFDDMMFEDEMMMMGEEPSSGGSAWVIILVVVLVLAAGVTAVILIRRKKKKAAKEEEALFDDEDLFRD
ncbi:MAG: hypothetical protein IJ036_03935 [Lachnospiraceae bacterium]|nr:hypothetical protein [Lachnospiraceae bacterium]